MKIVIALLILFALFAALSLIACCVVSGMESGEEERWDAD